MSTQSKSAQLDFLIKGEKAFPPTELQDLSILATFEEGEVQANITTDKFTFILDAYSKIKNEIQGGLVGDVGIFEGIPFDISATNINSQFNAFKGFIDLQDEIVVNDTLGQIEANIKKLDGLNSLNDRLSANTFDYLYEIGVFTDDDFTDIEYVVEIIDKSTQALILSITLFSLLNILYKEAEDFAEGKAITSAFVASVLGAAGAPVYEIAFTIIKIIYLSLLTAQLIALTRDLFNVFIPPRRTHKCINFKTVLEKTSGYLGYQFNTTISELDNIYYLPSNINYDESDNRGFLKKAKTITNGLPQARDYGFICAEFFELVRNMFNGRYGIFKGRLELHTELSDFWQKNSSYTLVDKLEEGYTYNTTDLKSNLIVAFNTDLKDEYTIDNFKGTNYQVITDAITIQDPKKKTIIGLDEIRIPVSLGNRKYELNFAENVLKVLAGTVDTLTAAFNVTTFGAIKKTNFKDQIKGRIGLLKVSTNNHSVPKVLYLNQDNKLPLNHRDLLSAKSLYNRGYFERSFIQNNYRRQRKVFRGVSIPFGFEDFLKLIDNSYFKTLDGRNGKVEKIEWNIEKDNAQIDYYIEEKYTRNLKETFIEPE